MAADDEEVFGSLYEGDDDSDSALPASSKFDVEDISSEEEEEDDNDDDDEEEEDDDLQIVLNDDENHHKHSNGSFPEQMFLHAHSNDLTSSKASYDVLTGPSKVNSNVFTRRSNGFTEFIVPQNKTIFDVNIDSLEDKKWRQPGADVSDFFNFGFNEESWKLYSNQMRFQIVGSHPTAATATFGQSAKQYKLEIKSFFERSEIPTGKPIQVEFSDIERLPSSNTRRPRPCDSDVIIEIPLHDDKENSCGTNELESSENCEGNWRETSKSSNYNTGKHELDHAIKSYSGKESHGHSDNQENRFFTPPSRLASDDRELSSDTICNIRTSTVVNNREHKLPNDQHSNGQIPCYDDECSPSPCKPKSGRSLMLHGKLKACDTMNTKTMHCGVQDREGEIVSGLEGKTCRSHYSVNESAADCSFSVNILKNDNSEFISRTSRDPLENFDDNMNEVVRCKSEKMFCCVTSMVPEKAEACSRENSYEDSKDLFVTKSDAPSESSHDVVNLLVTDLTSLEKNQNSRQCRKNDAGRNSKNRANCVNIKSVIVAADHGRHKHEKTIYSKQRIRQKDGWDTQSEHVPCKTKLVDGQIVQRIDRKKRNKIERSSRRENIECWDRHTKLYEKSPRNERANSQRRKEIGLLKRLEDSMAFNDQSVREEPISLQPLKPWFVADNSEGTTEKSMLMTRHENKKNGTSSLYSRRRLKNDSDSSHHYKKNAVYFHSSSSCLENDNNQMLYFDDTMDRTSSKEKHSRDPVCLRSHLINGTCISSFNSRRIETQREPVGLSTLYLNEKICTYATQEQGKEFRVQANCEILSHQIPNISDRPDEDLETNKVLATEATDFTQACEKIQKHSLLLAETNGFNNCITDLNVEEDVNQRETLMSSAERGSEICQGDQKSEGNDTRCRNSSLNIVHSHKKMEDSNQTVLSPQLLEALAKLEKRRERFKQPLVTENHVGRNNIQNKTNEQEISEVTQQRRSRKRKWGST